MVWNRRSLLVVMALGAAIGATACTAVGPHGSFSAMRGRSRVHDSLKAGYVKSTGGREAQALPVADILDSSV